MTRLLFLINLLLIGLLAVFSTLASFLYIQPTGEAPLIIPKVPKTELPKNSFSQPDMAYLAIADGPFATKWSAPKMQLPDLREELIYYGKNCRPDIQSEQGQIHVALKSSGESKVAAMGRKIYVNYNKGYHFTHNNHPSALWIEFSSSNLGDAVLAQVKMLDEKGQLIETPGDCAEFSIAAKELNKQPNNNWEIGGCRVDTTLLVRQRARWLGPDLFFEKHGGEEYGWTKGKERIDFMGDSIYSCFVSVGDYLIWKDGVWQQARQGQKSSSYPLLAVKKIDDKLMTLELWDVEGKSKSALHLVRTKEASYFPDINQEFKFVGAKTWSQFVLESRNGRMIIKPHDWLIQQEGGVWKKISTSAEVDDYVTHRMAGPLFILEKMIKKEGKQVLVGHLFNASRTEIQEISLPAEQISLSSRPSILPIPSQEVDLQHISQQLDDKAHRLTRGIYKNLSGEHKDE